MYFTFLCMPNAWYHLCIIALVFETYKFMQRGKNKIETQGLLQYPTLILDHPRQEHALISKWRALQLWDVPKASFFLWPFPGTYPAVLKSWHLVCTQITRSRIATSDFNKNHFSLSKTAKPDTSSPIFLFPLVKSASFRNNHLQFVFSSKASYMQTGER